MGERLAGKVAIVTGAGRGIGRAEALALADEGARVVIVDAGVARDGSGQDATPAAEVVAEIKARGGDALASVTDVTDWAAGRRAVEQTIDHFGRLDIVVNNAGIQINRDVFAITEEEWRRVLDIHLTGHFTITQPAAAIFRRQRSGRIINTSSSAGLGQLNHADYSAAKEGIIGLTRSLALELGPYGVTVNALRPRATTRMSSAASLRQEAQAPRPPDLIGLMAVYLCTDAAAHINGRDFYVFRDQISLISLPRIDQTIERAGGWSIADIERLFPATLGAGLVNPAPPTS